MDKFKKILNYLKKPHILFLVSIYIITIICVVLSLISVVKYPKPPFYAYIIFIISIVLLTYSTYIFITNVRSIKSKIIKLMEKKEFTKKLIKNYKFRTIVFSCFTFVVSIAYAIFEGILGIILSSIWFGALAFYYIVLSFMRGANLYYIHKRNNTTKVEEINDEYRLYKRNGYLLILLNLAFSAAVVQMVIANKGFQHPGLLIYVFATYAFYKITLAIINIFKARKHKSYSVQTIRNINLADALVSIVALQTAMFQEFGTGSNTRIYNGITGGIVCILIVIIGISMVIKSNGKIKKQLHI